MISFPKYAKIKDNYCIAYLGPCTEYLLLLDHFAPILETIHPGINVYLCCRDECVSIIKHPRCLPLSLLKQKKEELVHVKEIKYDSTGHPIEQFLIESGVQDFKILKSPDVVTSKAVIVSKGIYPTKPLNDGQIDWLFKKAREEGFQPELSETVQDAGYVLGVESFGLYSAALMGIKTLLVPTGVGTGFFKKLFPSATILGDSAYIQMKTGKTTNPRR